MPGKNQVYLDEKGREYTIQSMACCAGLGKVTKNVHILYQDGTKKVIPLEVHETHSKLEASIPPVISPDKLLQEHFSKPTLAQSSPSGTELKNVSGVTRAPTVAESLCQLTRLDAPSGLEPKLELKVSK